MLSDGFGDESRSLLGRKRGESQQYNTDVMFSQSENKVAEVFVGRDQRSPKRTRSFEHEIVGNRRAGFRNGIDMMAVGTETFDDLRSHAFVGYELHDRLAAVGNVWVDDVGAQALGGEFERRGDALFG